MVHKSVNCTKLMPTETQRLEFRVQNGPIGLELVVSSYLSLEHNRFGISSIFIAIPSINRCGIVHVGESNEVPLCDGTHLQVQPFCGHLHLLFNTHGSLQERIDQSTINWWAHQLSLTPRNGGTQVIIPDHLHGVQFRSSDQ